VGAVLFIHSIPVHAGGQLAEGPQGAISIAPDGLVARLLSRRLAVLALDVYGIGALASRQRDKAVAHFHCFNRSDAALRIQDVLTGLAYLRTRSLVVHLAGLGKAGLWCLLARGLATGVSRTVVDAAQFACEDDGAWLDDLYLPQIRRAGDLRTAAALTAPGALWVYNTGPDFPSAFLRQVYQVAAAPGALHIESQEASTKTIVGWLADQV
jgi:hypothetical protein